MKNSNERNKNVLKLNNIFREEKIKEISDQIHRIEKYSGSNYESDKSIHYGPGHDANYHSSEESKSIKNKRISNEKIVKKQF